MKKNRRWLKPEQAEKLNLDIKEPIRGRTSATYYITDEQWDFVKKQGKKKKESEFDLLAWTDDGRIMSIEEFCEHHKLSLDSIANYRLCTHTKKPTYNISWKSSTEIEKDQFDLLGALREEFETLPQFTQVNYDGDATTGVITLTDFHFGAYISAMLRTCL